MHIHYRRQINVHKCEKLRYLGNFSQHRYNVPQNFSERSRALEREIFSIRIFPAEDTNSTPVERIENLSRSTDVYIVNFTQFNILLNYLFAPSLGHWMYQLRQLNAD